MPDDNTTLLRSLIGSDPAAAAAVLTEAGTSDSPSLLVAAALLAHDPRTLLRAADHATTPRERQLVALADAHLRGDVDRLEVLVREHLSEHPDDLLAAWIAGHQHRNQNPQ